MTRELTRNSIAHVKYIDGAHPNRLRKWPHKEPELPEGPIIGKAPERSALLLLDVQQVSVQVNGKTKTFPNPRTDSYGRVWWYVRAYDGDSKMAVEGWTAEQEASDVYLELLPSHDGCRALMHTQRPSHLWDGMTAYVVSADGLKIRSGPFKTAPELGGLPAGGVVKVEGEAQCDSDGLVWWRIPQGWICEDEPIQGPADEDRVAWYLLPLTTSP